MLKFNVKNQIIERLDEFRVVADSKNYLTADFMLSDEWEDKKVFASFSHMDAALAKEVEVKDGQCFVPWEVIKPPFFGVSLFCGDLITSNEINIQVESSGLKDGEPAGAPTPSVWNEYLKQIEAITQEILSQQVGKKIPDGGTIFSESLKTLASIMGQITQGGIARSGSSMAVTVILMIPPIIVYLVTQSNVMESMSSAGIKG